MNYQDFDEYIRQGEPEKQSRAYYWQTAIGLQAVDGLQPSNYLLETAQRHIEGDITIEEAGQLIDSYYKSKDVRLSSEGERTEEADKVSQRITELLQEQTFSFSPVEYIAIHRRLFDGIYKHAGRIRDYNISKREWVLDGATVLYASAGNIRETLEFDFIQEKKFDYSSVSTEEAIRHIAKFISGIWQIHPFGEGNTRATAVFAIKYLRTFGFTIDNTPFARHSWYFRNALVRANYNDMRAGVFESTEWLERFFRNLLLGEQNELLNRELHIRYQPQSATETLPKCNSKCNPKCKNCTLDETAVLAFLKQNPKATQKEIAAHIHKSERTVKTLTVSLTEKGLLIRRGGRRIGYWEIVTEE